MAMGTYSDILAQVKMWSNRGDLTEDQLGSFIYFAGNMANQLLRVPPMEYTEVLTVNSVGHVVIPFNFLELRSLTYEWGTRDSQSLSRLAWDQFVNYYNTPEPENSKVRFFSRQGAYWFLSARAPMGSKVTCHYYRAMPNISPSEPENWLSQMSPMTYIFGALYYLFMFVQDEERATYWKTLFNEELGRIQTLCDGAEYKGTSLAVRSTQYSGD